MNQNNHGPKKPIPFPASAPGVPLIGQPFTVTAISIPVNAMLVCNCGGGAVVTITGSVAASCPSCRKLFNLVFNPTTMKIEVQIGLPRPEQVVS